MDGFDFFEKSKNDHERVWTLIWPDIVFNFVLFWSTNSLSKYSVISNLLYIMII